MIERPPIVITGASSGIGRAAAYRLARDGQPLVLVCRDGSKARAVHADLLRTAGNPAIELETADLSVQGEVRAVAQAIAKKHAALAGLINNAGAVFPKRQLSVDGIEMTFAVNHLAPFLLTNLLLEPLQAGAPARIVTVSSDLQRPLHLDDLDRRKAYNSYDVYGETKLANLLFSFELARRLAGSHIAVNALAPGFLRTGLLRGARPPTRLLLSLVGTFMMEPADKGGARIARMAVDPDLAGVSGTFYVKDAPGRASAPAYDTALASQLWAMSERLVGLTAEPPAA